MELDELMTNRVLLEKMSESTPFRTKHPKHVIIQENHKPPKEILIEYKNSHNNISYTTTERSMTPPPPPLIIEEYGCKYPHKLKKVLKILWFVLVFLYIFGMPIILVHMHTKLTETENRLMVLEKQFNEHNSKKSHSANIQIQAYKQMDGDNRVKTSDNEGKVINNLEEINYNKVMARLKTMKSLVDEHKKRYACFSYNIFE
jgi:hypothetical protein